MSSVNISPSLLSSRQFTLFCYTLQCLYIFFLIFFLSFSFFLNYLLLAYYPLLDFIHLHLSTPSFACLCFCTIFLISLSNLSPFLLFGQSLLDSRELPVNPNQSYDISFLELFKFPCSGLYLPKAEFI